MIQRIQSVYLLIAAILTALTCFLPLAEFMWGGEVFSLYAWGVRSAEGAQEPVFNMVYMGVLCVISTLLPLVTIFCYKRRWVQIRFCIAEMVLLAGVCAYVVIYLLRTHATLKIDGSSNLVMSAVDIFPLIALFFTYLAFRAIAKDEAMIRSLDRLR